MYLCGAKALLGLTCAFFYYYLDSLMIFAHFPLGYRLTFPLVPTIGEDFLLSSEISQHGFTNFCPDIHFPKRIFTDFGVPFTFLQDH